MSDPQPATALVTGATSGIGLHTAARLAAAGHSVLVTGRDHQRGQAAVAELRRRSGRDEVHFLRADHATVSGNLELAAAVSARVERLELLVNNVGGIYADRWESADGYEGTLAMDFVGPFALTRCLLPLLRDAGGRCVNVVSSAFAMAKGDPLHDLQSQGGYVGIQAYARAKLLNVLWTSALAEREPAVTVYAVNPGMAWTSSTRQLTPKAVPAWRLVWPVVRWFQRRASAEAASRAPFLVATAGELQAPSGSYFDEKGRHRPLPANARNHGDTQAVWSLGETLVAGAPSLKGRPPTMSPSRQGPGGHDRSR
jgi:NAD(P)-dependent dehydrogenase (short-subunit alcohol dehydrogenase family)